MSVTKEERWDPKKRAFNMKEPDSSTLEKIIRPGITRGLVRCRGCSLPMRLRLRKAQEDEGIGV